MGSMIRSRTNRSTALRTSLGAGPHPSSEAAISAIVFGPLCNSPRYSPSVASKVSRAAHSALAASNDLRPVSLRAATIASR